MSADPFPPITGLADVNGGLASRADYSFTTDQFRSTGEFPNDAYRITTGTANLGYRFSDRRSCARCIASSIPTPATPVPGRLRPAGFSSNRYDRDSTLSVRLDDRAAATSPSACCSAIIAIATGFRQHHRELRPGGVDPHRAGRPSVCLLRARSARLHDGSRSGTTIRLRLSATLSRPTTHRTIASYQGTLTHRGGALVFGYDYRAPSRTDFRRRTRPRQQRPLCPRAIRADVPHLHHRGSAPGTLEHIRHRIRAARRPSPSGFRKRCTSASADRAASRSRLCSKTSPKRRSMWATRI